MRHFAWIGLLGAWPALAATTAVTTATNPPPSTSLLQWLVSCFLVIGLILLLAWLLKKSRLVPALAQNQLRVISALPLGNREKLLVVKVGEQQVLLGMTPTNINLLCQLETPLAEPAATMPFAAQLAKLMKPGQATADAATNQGSKDEA
ncbi:MAG: flagellar biosynthetic protein FliO [Aeromonadaceae bacterium]|nr:flagellar biosynthetic protein FliO [Aeromonadaceae bacterium]